MTKFEVIKRYSEYGDDWRRYEIISRQGNTIIYTKIQHTGRCNEIKSEPKKAKIKQWEKGEIFLTTRGETIVSF